MHANCRLDISGSDKLNRSKSRQQKRKKDPEFPDHPECPDHQPATKRLRSSVGIVHEKDLCVWCMNLKIPSIPNAQENGFSFRTSRHGTCSKATP